MIWKQAGIIFVNKRQWPLIRSYGKSGWVKDKQLVLPKWQVMRYEDVFDQQMETGIISLWEHGYVAKSSDG